MASQVTNGIDARLVPLEGGLYDIAFDFAGDIATEDSFDTALVVSLLTDRRADPSEVPEPQRRRGWIGDEDADVPMGSKIWLFEQSRRTRTNLNRLEDAARRALTWLVDRGYATRISGVTATPVDRGGISLRVTVERPGGEVETRFFQLWNCTGVS